MGKRLASGHAGSHRHDEEATSNAALRIADPQHHGQ